MATKYRDLIDRLSKDGWFHVHTTGSHLHFRHPTKAGLVTVPGGGKLAREVAPVTLRSSSGGITMIDMNYTVIIEPAGDGSFSAYVPDLPGCVSSGDTYGEAMANIAEAIRGHVAILAEAGEPIPAPRSKAEIVAA